MDNVTILNVGHGDTKLSFDPKKPADRKRASRIVGEMLKLGFAICVRVGDRWIRASAFDPEKTEYLIKESPRGRRKGVPAESTRAVSVSRSAGGMSKQVDSVEVQNLHQFDKLHSLRMALRKAADEKDEWAGIPMPLDGQPLVMDPKWELAAAFTREAEEVEPGVKLRNCFYSTRLRTNVLIWNEPDGEVAYGFDGTSQAALQIHTLGASAAWGVEQEAAALETLAELLRHPQFKTYLLTGMFLETSLHSHVTYCFRKLRPTLAMRPTDDGQMKILAALCMHPIAYYDGSWAGAMTPSDDVLAHLMLMRADEKFYWRRCNQHHPGRVEAGL
jgi:hypothetical protein